MEGAGRIGIRFRRSGVRLGDVPVRTAILQHLHMDVWAHEADPFDVDLVAEKALDIDRGGEGADPGQVDPFERGHVAHLHMLHLHGEVRETFEDGEIPFTPIHHRIEVLVHLLLHGRFDPVLEQDGDEDGGSEQEHDEDPEADQNTFGPLCHEEGVGWCNARLGHRRCIG